MCVLLGYSLFTPLVFAQKNDKGLTIRTVMSGGACWCTSFTGSAKNLEFFGDWLRTEREERW